MIDSREYFITVVALGLGFLLLVLFAWIWAHRRRQRMAREVERNEALFDAFFNAAPAGMAILDRELNVARINSTLMGLLQLPTAETLSANGVVLRTLPAGLASRLLPHMTEVLMSNQPLEQLEISLPADETAPSARTASNWLVSLFPVPTPFGRNPLGLGMVVQDIAPLKASQQALEQSRAELRRLGAHREQQMEGEYQRLAREFHDELGQLLTTARMRLQLLGRQSPSAQPSQADQADQPLQLTQAQLAASTQAIDELLAEAYRSIKAIAADLRPPALNLGLPAAIEWLVERMLLPTGVRCDVLFPQDGALDQLPGELALAAFRILQEALTNIVRHAAARNVRIVLARTQAHEAEGAGLRVLIADDGQGFDLAQLEAHTANGAHFGLLGMRERVAALAGRLDINAAPGAGTRISVWLPDNPV